MPSVITTVGTNQINSTNASLNANTGNYIQYNFASKAGVSKVGKYIGTGAAGNYVDCGFKVGWVMIKNLTTSANGWFIEDSTRPDSYLVANSSGAEAGLVALEFVDGGFVLVNTSGGYNELNSEFLFLAFAETALDGTKQTTDYSYPTTADTLSIAQNTLISFANGFSASGQVDTQENVGAGVTYTLGVGFEDKHLWLYKDKAGSYGVTENRPLEGLTRNLADTYGVESPLDASLRTTAKHFDYESSTGVVLASSELAGGTRPAYQAFNKLGMPASAFGWVTNSITTGWLQYKGTEKRIAKSYRFMSPDFSSVLATNLGVFPKDFELQGSDDGLNWTAINSQVTYIPTGDGTRGIWEPLIDTSANTTAYLYHRLNVTLNNGGTALALGELEINTILPSDYYLVNEGIQYNSAGTPIERTYLAELRTNADGDVATYRNLPVAKQRFNEVEVHGDLVVRGDIENRGVATAWVNFNGSQNPPLILEGEGFKDVVDLGVGHYKPLFENSTNVNSYVVTATLGDALDLAQNRIVKTGNKTTLGFEVQGQNTASAATDQIVDITVFGGKD